jgi:hypothetical protein
MVVAEEIKTSNTVYECLDNVILSNPNTSVSLNHIISFHESDLEIEIETYFPADNLKRGWVGDMCYEATRGFDITTDQSTNTTHKKYVKDILLARVNSYKDGPECVIFTYTFLKY